MNASGPGVRELFRSIQRDDPSRTIDQLGSLVAAFQYRKLYDLTARLVVPGSHVLDWGCGRGHFAYFLVKAGFRVTAYSLEHEPEVFASLSPTEHGRLAFVRGTDTGSRRLPFEAGKFSAVFSVGVLEHVREMGGDEPSSLAEIRRVLARDGVFVCYHLPNRYSYIEALSRWLKKPGPGSEHEAFHEHRFTERAIRRLCVEAQLAVSEVRRYGFVPRNSFNRLPQRLRDSPGFASLVNLGDAALERLFSPLDQNYYFLARPTEHTMDPKGLA
jgi:SAM-dependent methyltransferase